MHREVNLLDTPLDCEAALKRLEAGARDAGGIASFIGKVREGGGVEALALSHYEPMTLPGIEARIDAACARFTLQGVVALHRVGEMGPGEPIVLVAAAARHRRDAISAVDYLMDHLKCDAWLWKRERVAGQWHWIEPRAQDFDDLSRWADQGELKSAAP